MEKIETKKPKLKEMEGWIRCKSLLSTLYNSKKEGEEFSILEDIRSNIHIVSSLNIDLRKVSFFVHERAVFKR